MIALGEEKRSSGIDARFSGRSDFGVKSLKLSSFTREYRHTSSSVSGASTSFSCVYASFRISFSHSGPGKDSEIEPEEFGKLHTLARGDL